MDVRMDDTTASYLVPLGPVTVFGASNFPLAFSTLGGDTASALAAQCSVVYKLHPAHPLTTRISERVVKEAMKEEGLHTHVFSVVEGDIGLGHELVRHKDIKAVGFTGSLFAGQSLLKTAQSRDEPIPFYAEMGSVNPVFIFPEALNTNYLEISKGLSESVTVGVGQYCTNPGLVFVAGSNLEVDRFICNLVENISQVHQAQMLTKEILCSYIDKIQQFASLKGVKQVYRAESGLTSGAGPTIFSVDFSDFIASSNQIFQKEIFGPCTLLVRCSDVSQFKEISHVLEGQLTSSFHAVNSDVPAAMELVSAVSLKVGRLIWNGFPTGVLVNEAMQHGGPWPSSSDSRTTSVGSRSILRWVRPLCFQGFPPTLLPSHFHVAE
eukprot:TRINITY_DN3080_c0_g1_i7.p1 TRINITY_DN3080_c0_g1~~TRINITY_DN3080_c0_g1_i7.p1  ORF type:complete len:380 (-),score=50.50 TRINITY_DN3080_c0_g1_i7:153-1292(-)